MQITFLDLAYNDFSCLNISSSSFLFSQKTLDIYSIYIFVNSSVAIETVGQYSFNRKGLNAMQTYVIQG